ncbi:MAG: hypothetical protein PHU75_10075 [Candidatus Nanopelagicales bacterium]|nr:hypothetical protein [Candidatus Nanopelagicales bacterium]
MRKTLIAAGTTCAVLTLLPVSMPTVASAAPRANLSSFICTQLAGVPSAPPIATSFSAAAGNMGVIARWRYALDTAEAKLLVARRGHDSWRGELTKRANLAHSASIAAQKWWDTANVALEDNAISSGEASRIRSDAQPAIDRYRQLTKGC